MSEKFLSGRYELKPVSDRITEISSNWVLYHTLYQKWGNTGPEMGETWPVSLQIGSLRSLKRGPANAARRGGDEAPDIGVARGGF